MVAFEEHEGNVMDMCVMRESILTASADKTVRKWSIEDEQCEAKFLSHKSGVFMISPLDANLFATAGHDNAVKV